MCSEELNDFYFSPDIIRVIKSRRMNRAVLVAHIEEKRNSCWVLVRKRKEIHNLEDLRVR